MVHARFYAPELASGQPVVPLPPEEGTHLTRVLRLRAGSLVQVFDGRGQEFLARVESAGRTGVFVRRLEPVLPVPEPAVGVTLAQALLKGEHLDDVVRDAVMLGVTAVQPIVSEHTEARVAKRRPTSRTERWERVAIASVKQCGRAVVPVVRAPLSLREYLGRETAACRIVLVEPRAAALLPRLFVPGAAGQRPSSAAILIGPEGGWADGELQEAGQHDFCALTLGPRTLRADRAPVAALAVLQYLWGDQ